MIRVSAYQDAWLPVPSPTAPLTHQETGVGRQYNGVPAVSRVEHFKYALVDKEGKISPWSPPLALSFLEGGGVYFNLCEFVPAGPEIVAIVWDIDGWLGQLQDNGVGPAEIHAPSDRPWCPIRPDLCTDLRRGLGGFTMPTIASTVLTQAPPMPILRQFAMPNVDLKIAYCWVTDDGETELSPSFVSPKLESVSPLGVSYRKCYAPQVQAPSGAKGYRVYAKKVSGGSWNRCYAPHRKDNSTADDYLFQLDDMQPLLLNWNEFTHPDPVDGAESLISGLQQAIDAAGPNETVVVDAAVIYTTCPIIDHYGPGNGKHDIRIVGENGSRWELRQRFDEGASFGTYWPMILCQNQRSVWEGARVVAPKNTNNGGMLCASAGLAFSDFSGGQAMSCTFRDCHFLMRRDTDTQGVRVLDKAACGFNEHTASELYFDSCRFEAATGIRIEGNQSANIRFNRTFVAGDGERRRGTAALWINTPNSVVFTGGLFADYGYTGFYLGTHANVRVDDIWIDQGYECFFDAFGYYPVTVKLRGGKMNAWDQQGNKFPWLLRSALSTDASDLPFEDVVLQTNHQGGLFEFNCYHVLGTSGIKLPAVPWSSSIKVYGVSTVTPPNLP